jgi:hypothetical protein
VDPAVDVGALVEIDDGEDIEAYAYGAASAVSYGLPVLRATSPLGAALKGKQAGDTVTFQAPGGLRTVRIVRHVSTPMQDRASLEQASAEAEPHPQVVAQSVTVIVNDEDAYWDWLKLNPNGSVVRPPKSRSDNAMLHRSDCMHIADPSPNFTYTTGKKYKVCAVNRSSAEKYAKAQRWSLVSCECM